MILRRLTEFRSTVIGSCRRIDVRNFSRRIPTCRERKFASTPPRPGANSTLCLRSGNGRRASTGRYGHGCCICWSRNFISRCTGVLESRLTAHVSAEPPVGRAGSRSRRCRCSAMLPCRSSKCRGRGRPARPAGSVTNNPPPAGEVANFPEKRIILGRMSLRFAGYFLCCQSLFAQAFLLD